jgi:transcription elongation factor Elf1
MTNPIDSAFHILKDKGWDWNPYSQNPFTCQRCGGDMHLQSEIGDTSSPQALECEQCGNVAPLSDEEFQQILRFNS